MIKKSKNLSEVIKKLNQMGLNRSQKRELTTTDFIFFLGKAWGGKVLNAESGYAIKKRLKGDEAFNYIMDEIKKHYQAIYSGMIEELSKDSSI
jgi:hypothetical protein